MKSQSAIIKYLHRYAEPEVHWVKDAPAMAVQNLVVMPCYQEALEDIQGILRWLSEQEKTLLILVVNQPPGDINRDNAQVVEYLDVLECLWACQHLKLYQLQNSSYCLLVKRCEFELCIPVQEGVGLARKIGADIAVALIHHQQLKVQWVYSTDADAELPKNYFEPFQAIDNISARTFKTTYYAKHPADVTVLKATEIYAKALDYYVQGLAWAGSPYAHASIGSALAFTPLAYCCVRGFPKKSGGEDFYLLNKLAKINPIVADDRIIIRLQARLSQRVPFGTGPAVSKILALKTLHEFSYFSPQVFIYLKEWLNIMPLIWQHPTNVEALLTKVSPAIRTALEPANLHTWVNHLQRIKTLAQAERHSHDWFDGFQTLKFLRRLQASSAPAVPLIDVLKTTPFISDWAEIALIE